MDDKEIEAVARQLCERMGMDPDTPTSYGVDEQWTDAEAERERFVHDVMLHGPLWVKYRRLAARAIAGRGTSKDLLPPAPALPR